MSTAILMSGGFDSIAVGLKVREDADFVFMNYHQKYHDKEKAEALRFCRRCGVPLHTITIPWGHTNMYGRNYEFLSFLSNKGYDKVYMGIRNPTPIGDKHGDANWWGLKLCSMYVGIKVRFPIMFWTKRKVFKYLKSMRYTNIGYNCYDNNDDYKTCTCLNCIERRRYQ